MSTELTDRPVSGSGGIETIVFFGTPDFAVPSLRACARRYRVAAVVSQPDRPSGRGHKLRPTPIKLEAERLGIPVYQPEKLEQIDLSVFDPDLFVVVAFGQLLTPEVLRIPRFGSVNLHGSLLPKYRGAAPMQRAIEDGLSVSGVTTMLMDEGLDTGDLLLSESIDIRDMGIAQVHDLFAERGSSLLVRTIDALSGGRLVPRPQEHASASYAPKIRREDYEFRHLESIGSNIARMRSFGWLKAEFAGRRFKLFAAERAPFDVLCSEPEAPEERAIYGAETPEESPYIFTEHEVYLRCSDGWIRVLELQPENGKRMTARSYLIGRRDQ